ncbi:4851_t:CDS:2, partial [Dentiscutata heterogama]
NNYNYNLMSQLIHSLKVPSSCSHNPKDIRLDMSWIPKPETKPLFPFDDSLNRLKLGVDANIGAVVVINFEIVGSVIDDDGVSALEYVDYVDYVDYVVDYVDEDLFGDEGVDEAKDEVDDCDGESC